MRTRLTIGIHNADDGRRYGERKRVRNIYRLDWLVLFVLTLTPKVFRVHRQRLVHVSDLDKTSAIDIPIHDDNYGFGWKRNDAQVLVIRLHRHRWRVQFDNTFGHLGC
jgi:hypothetical protein